MGIEILRCCPVCASRCEDMFSRECEVENLSSRYTCAMDRPPSPSGMNEGFGRTSRRPPMFPGTTWTRLPCASRLGELIFPDSVARSIFATSAGSTQLMLCAAIVAQSLPTQWIPKMSARIMNSRYIS
nr:hypothetical protein CFP56_09536 [Quercus suber]